MQHTLTVGQPGPCRLVTAALDQVLKNVDRGTPLGEAQVAALEAAQKLLEAETAAQTPPDVRAEILREALGSARAAVSAAATAVTLAQDSRRHASRAEFAAAGQ